MKRQINLIPEEMAVAGKTVTLAKILNKISIVGTILLILVVVVLISGLVYFNIEYKKTTTNVASLKKQIVELEKNEQKLILAKDKLSKISYVKGIDSVDTEFTKFTDLQNLVATSSASNFTEVTIDPIKTDTTFVFPDTTTLSSALDNIQKIKDFKKVVMTSLGYSASTGYLVSIIFTD